MKPEIDKKTFIKQFLSVKGWKSLMEVHCDTCGFSELGWNAEETPKKIKEYIARHPINFLFEHIQKGHEVHMLLLQAWRRHCGPMYAGCYVKTGEYDKMGIHKIPKTRVDCGHLEHWNRWIWCDYINGNFECHIDEQDVDGEEMEEMCGRKVMFKPCNMLGSHTGQERVSLHPCRPGELWLKPGASRKA